ncbi:uncharacterized protein LOC144608865 [Rhinoraja longicauda]
MQTGQPKKHWWARLRERLRLALGSGCVDADIGSSGSGSVFARPGVAGLGSRTFHRPARPMICRGIFLCWAGASMSGATTAPTCSNSSSVFARPGSDLSSAEPAVFGGCGSGWDSP